MASSDTGELASVCDRVLVMSDGIAAAEITGPALTEERLVIEALDRRVRATAAPTTETTTHE
jgi:ABC-type sugar transport system ATPase subunit